MLTHSFTECRLWTAIDQKRADDTRANLAASSVLQTLTDAETLLRSAGTSPTDFTLHDADHAYRVAEQMANIILEDSWNKLSLYELSLLLLSAYVHDIGMVPELSRMQAIHDFMLTCETPTLPDDEVDTLVGWLEENAITTPIADGPNSIESLRLARESAAHYCRYRHNDWSEKWVRDNVALDRVYRGCVDDLILICRSHHEGYDSLVSSDFDPFRMPGFGHVVHRRYLACVLRVADILDVDPERTPPIIYRHRSVSEGSEIYWKKDQAIAISLPNDTVHLAAEPLSAILHKAIEGTADDIAKELDTCYRISIEKPFAFDSASPEAPLPHRWRLRPYLHRRITPRNGAYEYIDGSFRPNSDKVLQLLGSRELYTSPITAIRELLQNAFDGVRERIAVTHLLDTAQHFSAPEVANRFVVTLSLETDGDDLVLICEDDGAGMTKEIIQNHFLISGNSVRPDLQALARRCKKRGIELNRTGQFGIGVLSYFLLADRVDVETRRAPECGDDDGTAWHFRTEGVGTFGELRRSNCAKVGTAVRLRLRHTLVDNMSAFAESVRDFVENTIIRSPCRFRFNITGDETWVTNAGWTRDTEKLNELAFKWMRHSSLELASTLAKPLADRDTVTQRAQHAAAMSAIHELAARSVTWHTSDDIDIEGLGVCRIHVPSFSVNGKPSPYFLFAKPGSDGRALKVFDFEHGKTVCMAANDTSVISWKGMATRARTVRDMNYSVWEFLPNREDVLVEIDLCSSEAGKLSLNREFVDMDDDEGVHAIERKCHPYIADFKASVAKRLADSPYAPFWYTTQYPRRVPDEVPRYWSQTPNTINAKQLGFVDWCPVECPAMDRIDWLPHNSLTFRSSAVTEQHLLSRYVASGWKPMTLPWSPSGVALLCKNGVRVAVVPVWMDVDDSSEYCEAANEYGNYQRVAVFPAAWNDVVGVSPPVGAPIWNGAFAPVVAYTRDANKWLLNQGKNGHWADAENAIQIVESAMGDASRESAVLFDCIRSPQRWVALTRIAPVLANQLWDRWVGQSRRVHYVTHRLKDECLETGHNCFSREGCKITTDLASLPDPEMDWRVEAR